MAYRNSGIIVVVEGKNLAASAERLTRLLGTGMALTQQLAAEFAGNDPALNAWVAEKLSQLRCGDLDKLEGITHDGWD